jgi:alcohol dehydrogenase
MLLGAAYAGTAIENSMLGCTHAAANPLTARYGVVHGHAVGLLAGAVLGRNMADTEAAAEYAALATHAGLESVAEMRARVAALLPLARMPSMLSALGVDEASLPEMAEAAATQWTASFNPVAYSVEDFQQLYREVLV